MVDALVSGTSASRRGGSSPLLGTIGFNEIANGVNKKGPVSGALSLSGFKLRYLITFRLTLDVSSDGYASLQVTSNNRQPISFNGYVTERKKK